MNRFAEIKYGKVHDIVETLQDMEWIHTIFSPLSVFIDVTNVNDTEGRPVQLGCIYENGVFKPPIVIKEYTLDDHKKIALERKTNLVNQKIEDGFYSEALGERKFFGSSKEDQENMEDMISLHESGTEVDLYVTAKPNKDADELARETITVTIEQLKAVWEDFKTHRVQCRKRGTEIDRAIRNSKFVQEVYQFLNWEK